MTLLFGHPELETLVGTAAVMLGVATFLLIRRRRRREQAVLLGILAAVTVIAVAARATEPSGLGGVPHILVWGSLLVFLILPLTAVVGVMEYLHHRRRRKGG